MYKIAIGTKSEYKINAIKTALCGLDIDFVSSEANVETGVSEQPIKPDESRVGSINRAKNILKTFPDHDFGIGVEFGYEPFGNTFKMVCWASIYTKEGNLYSEQSSTLELPLKLKQSLLNDVSVDSELEGLFKSLSYKYQHVKMIEFLKKRKFIYQSVENVALRWALNDLIY